MRNLFFLKVIDKLLKLKYLILQEKLWEIAIKKSYLIPDINNDETSKESVQTRLMELLKNKYPDI